MKLSLFRVCLSLLLLGLCKTQTCPSDSGWVSHGNKCYYFTAYPRLALRSAITACQDHGATLVSVNSETEHKFIAGWLLQNDNARGQWLTSGLTSKAGVRWAGDGALVTNFNKWIIPVEMRELEGLPLLYAFDATDSQYGWTVAQQGTKHGYICEISVAEVYRILQEYRDFDYGLDIRNPSLAPRGPTFLQEPASVIVLGKTVSVHLECLASGNPEPTYEWFIQNRNQQMVPLQPSRRYSFTSGRLEIIYPTIDDESTYQCKANNEFGTILSRFVQLSFGYLGEFSNVEPASVNGLEYDGAQLECPGINARPAKSYQWFKDQYNFIRPEFQKYTFISSNGKLYFSELTPIDQGTYYCLVTPTNFGRTGTYIGASQVNGKNSRGFDLTVTTGGASQYQPEIQNDFIFVYPPTPMAGSYVSLECFAYGTGPLIYTWSRADNKALPAGHSFSSNNRILRLPDAKLEDGGIYTCRVFSTATNLGDSRSVDLKIQSEPYFTYPLTHQHVDIGSHLTWHCEASGHPLPTYKWYKNGQILTSGNGVTVNINTITIDSVEPKRDSGMYQCAATNKYGTTFSTAQLRALELQPKFTKTPLVKSLAGATGGQVTIICNPEAAPTPTYQWFKDGSNLNLVLGQYAPEDHYKLLLNGNLVITNLQRGDQGRYTCETDNSLGKASDFSDLKLFDRTVITQSPNDQRVEVNLTATLMCRASHPPNIDMVYVWKFNDHVIDYNVEPEYRRGEGSQKGSLYIVATQVKNQGRYTCLATTGMDQVSASAYLTVVGPPGEPAGVIVLLSSPNNDVEPNDPNKVVDPQTSRWIVWTDGETRGSLITHYFIEFHTNFDKRWRIHPDGNNVPVSRVTDQQYPTKRYIQLTNLKAGAGVSFRVKARNSYGIGPPSIPSLITQIAAAKPSQMVKNVRGGGGSVGDLTIVWDPLPLEDHNGPNLEYKVSWRTFEAGSQSNSSKWRTVTIPHKVACFLEPNYETGLTYLCKYAETVGANMYFKPYEVSVQAANIKGDGPSTPVAQIMSAEELPLGAPESVFAENVNSTALLVTWKPVPNNRESARGRLKGYKINYWRMEGEVESQALQSIVELQPGEENLSKGMIIGLNVVTWYSFNVQAYNHAGNGPKSSTYDQETLLHAPRNYPTEVHVYSVEGFGVRVTFRGISTRVHEEPLEGYKVQYWKAYENIRNAVEANFGKTTTGVIRNLSSSELYELRIFGYSHGGQGKRSSPSVYFTVGDGQILINAETTAIFDGVPCLMPSVSIYLFSGFLVLIFSGREIEGI